MNDGRLFQLPQRPASRKRKLRRTGISGMEHFWLCDQCQTFFTLAFRPDSGVTVIPLAELTTSKKVHEAADSSSTRISVVAGGPQWNA
jgi:hypothetical protein